MTKSVELFLFTKLEFKSFLNETSTEPIELINVGKN